jgi:hypothetical protein
MSAAKRIQPTADSTIPARPVPSGDVIPGLWNSTSTSAVHDENTDCALLAVSEPVIHKRERNGERQCGRTPEKGPSIDGVEIGRHRRLGIIHGKFLTG